MATPASMLESFPTQLSQKDSCRSPGALAESHLCRLPAIMPFLRCLSACGPLQSTLTASQMRLSLASCTAAHSLHTAAVAALHERVTEAREKSRPGTSYMCVLLHAACADSRHVEQGTPASSEVQCVVNYDLVVVCVGGTASVQVRLRVYEHLSSGASCAKMTARRSPGRVCAA